MSRARVLALLLGAFVAAGACASSTYTPPWRITQADAGRRVRVPVGTVIDVALPGNPTTGYIWERAPGDPGGLTSVGAAQFVPDSAVEGQGGDIHVQFRVTKEGATPLALVYRRPFEKGTPSANTFWVTIVGEPD